METYLLKNIYIYRYKMVFQLVKTKKITLSCSIFLTWLAIKELSSTYFAVN